MADPRAYFEIDRAGGADQGQWIWRIKSWGDHRILARSDLLETREEAMRQAAIVRDDIGANQGIWDQTVEPESKWVRLPPVASNRGLRRILFG